VCGTPNFKGDGFCDDNNNNCGCAWDGGDCCGSTGKAKQFNYCTSCKCLDPTNVQNGCTGSCWKTAYVGDNFCDDQNNKCGCSWDGGDCCGGKTNYCTQCLCLDPDFLVGGCTKSCGSLGYYDDGFCDDNNNNCGCGWDGGDCCGTSGKLKQYQYCTACQCLDPAAADGSCSAFCGSPGYFDDGFCDDNNNNCGCGWDGGDCCGISGKAKQFQYCSACECLDPGAYCASACGASAYYDDGFCDDLNNNCGCGWDGGDCCEPSGKQKQFDYCAVCDCLDPAVLAIDPHCDGACGVEAYFADGWCDDDNNNCACSWDGGDCCGSTGKASQYNYCTLCKCRDPTLQLTTVSS
jgi:hypothetical protein